MLEGFHCLGKSAPPAWLWHRSFERVRESYFAWRGTCGQRILILCGIFELEARRDELNEIGPVYSSLLCMLLLMGFAKPAMLPGTRS